MRVRYIYLEREYEQIKEEIDQKVMEIIRSGRYILGNEVIKIEKKISNYCGTKFAVGVNSGTDALFLCLKGLNIGPGDIVITTPFTFVATANVIVNAGAEPYFIDIDKKTFNIDPYRLEEALKNDDRLRKKAKAIIPVHLFGQMAKMDHIKEIAEEYNLRIIEDAAQAFGAKYKDKPVGYYGDCAAFSFFPTKNLACYGDGGMVITDDEELYEKILMFRMHGQKRKYFCEINGFNSRLDEIQAGILNIKMKYIDQFIESRRKNASLYNDLLSEVQQVKTPYEDKDSYHTYNVYTIQCERRDKLQEYLKIHGIDSMVYYPYPLHKQKCFEKYARPNLENSEALSKNVLSLPLYMLKPEEIEYVSKTIKEFYL
ncbi:MAG: DegT/DnrJ/EryC1/StrS family aminotransferase [Candidatus Njordarchaeia archaeon]